MRQADSENEIKQTFSIRLVIVVAAALLLIPLLTYGAYQMWQTSNSKSVEQMMNFHNTNPIKFDKATWWTTKPETGIRQQMVNNLLSKYPLVGMRRDKVVNLLGPLESPWGFGDGEEGYHLNERDSAGSMWLRLQFKDGAVVSVRVWNFNP